MAERLTIQIKDNDNVVVAVHDLPAGTKTESGVVTRDPIPQAHKIALVDIPAGGEVIRYGVVLGYAKNDIPAGSWINEHMLDLPESPALTDMPWGTDIKTPDQLPTPPRTTWMGYRNKVGPAGTRNLLGIVTTVQCAAGVVKVAVERIKKELLPKYPNVDGVVAITHPYGCGVAINAPLAYIPIRAITNVIRHPNFGGEVMVVGLGCEKLTYDRVLPPEDINPENCLTLQDWKGHDAMMQAILDMAEKKLQKLNLRHREELPLSELLIGMQCGGSDAFSGITANPSAGYAADMLVKGGATREGECGPRHHYTGVCRHPVRKVTEGVLRQLDVRVQDEVHPAVQQAEHRVVSGAEAAVLCAAEHLHLLVLADVQGAVLRGLGKALAAAVRAGVVHQIQRQRVAAGAVQHGLCRPERFIRAVINYNTSRKFHVVHSSGLMSKLKSSFIRSKFGFMQGSPAASCFAHRFWKRSTSEMKRLRLTGFSSRPRLLLS